MADLDPMAGMSGSEPQSGIGGGSVSVGPEDAAVKQPESTSQTSEPSPTDGTGQGTAASEGVEGGAKKGSFAERVKELVGKDMADFRQSMPSMIAEALKQAGIAPKTAEAAAAAPGMDGSIGAKFKADVEQFGADVAMENYNKAMLGTMETRFDRVQATSWLHGQPEAKEPDFVTKWEQFSDKISRQYPFMEALAKSDPIRAVDLAMTLYRADPANAAKSDPVAATVKPTGNPAGIPKEAVISPGTGAGTAGANANVWTPALFNQRILEVMGLQDATQRREASNKLQAEYEMAKATGRWKEA